jgi:hypothetical protein
MKKSCEIVPLMRDLSIGTPVDPKLLIEQYQASFLKQ